MTIRRFLTCLILAFVLAGNAAGAASTTIIVRLKERASIQLVSLLLGGTVLDQMPGDRTYLLSVPALPSFSLSLIGVEYAEANETLQLPRVLQAAVLSSRQDMPAHWYAAQPGMAAARSPGAHEYATGRGVVVADIDANFDYDHPALRGRLTGGFDFVTGQQGRAALDQSSAGFLYEGSGGLDQSSAGFLYEGSGIGLLDQSSASFLFSDEGLALLNQSSAGFLFEDGGILDQSSAGFLFEEGGLLDQSSAGFLFDGSHLALLDQSSAGFLFDYPGLNLLSGSVGHLLSPRNAAYSHGTFTAGLIAATAPEAMIMPLRAFNDQGEADLFTLAKAVRYAASNGAHVVNMSWGTTTNSETLKAAIEFARRRGVILVTSAGNANSPAPVYPAAYPGVIAVAATDYVDRKAAFSNFGGHIYVSAPGVNIISAYPGGSYGISSGTSFSAPIVSGQAALIRALQATGVELQIGSTVDGIDRINPGYAGKLGLGRIHIRRSVRAGEEN